ASGAPLPPGLGGQRGHSGRPGLGGRQRCAGGRVITPRAHPVDVMNRADPGPRPLDAEIEQIRRQARRRGGRFCLDVADPGSRVRDRECRPRDSQIFYQVG
ncbi:hypothetical protein UK12_35360, partial [Saccharothrix sp. ST-888]